MMCRVVAVKSLSPIPYIILVQVIFYFLWDHCAHPGYFENQIPHKLVLGFGWGAYAPSQTTVLHIKKLIQTDSDFCDIVCSLFPKAILFDFWFTLL